MSSINSIPFPCTDTPIEADDPDEPSECQCTLLSSSSTRTGHEEDSEPCPGFFVGTNVTLAVGGTYGSTDCSDSDSDSGSGREDMYCSKMSTEHVTDPEPDHGQLLFKFPTIPLDHREVDGQLQETVFQVPVGHARGDEDSDASVPPTNEDQEEEEEFCFVDADADSLACRLGHTSEPESLRSSEFEDLHATSSEDTWCVVCQ